MSLEAPAYVATHFAAPTTLVDSQHHQAQAVALHQFEEALTLLVSLHRRARRQQAIEPKVVVTKVPCRASWWRTLASPTLAVAWSAWYRMTSLRTR